MGMFQIYVKCPCIACLDEGSVAVMQQKSSKEYMGHLLPKPKHIIVWQLIESVNMFYFLYVMNIND